MERQHPADDVLGDGRTLLASVGRRLVRYRLGDAGFVEQDSLEMPLAVQYACFHPGRRFAYSSCDRSSNSGSVAFELSTARTISRVIWSEGNDRGEISTIIASQSLMAL